LKLEKYTFLGLTVKAYTLNDEKWKLQIRIRISTHKVSVWRVYFRSKTIVVEMVHIVSMWSSCFDEWNKPKHNQ